MDWIVLSYEAVWPPPLLLTCLCGVQQEERSFIPHYGAGSLTLPRDDKQDKQMHTADRKLHWPHRQRCSTLASWTTHTHTHTPSTKLQSSGLISRAMAGCYSTYSCVYTAHNTITYKNERIAGKQYLKKTWKIFNWYLFKVHFVFQVGVY